MEDNFVYFDAYYEALTCHEVMHNAHLLALFPIIFVSYLAFTILVRKTNRFYNLSTGDLDSIQSILIVVPLFKVVQCVMFSISLGLCYMESDIAINTQRYLLMLLVAAETVSRTAIATMFYMIANGWGVLNFDYDPLEAVNSAKFIAIAYLCHSSYFVTEGPWSVHLYLRAILILFYIGASYKIIRRTSESFSTLKRL